MIDVIELLQLRGLDTSSRVKLIRHQDKRYDLRQLRREGLFKTYQSYQSRAVFECDYIVSFLGEERRKAVLLGVYRVNGRMPATEKPLPPGFPRPDLVAADGFYYDLDELPGFDDLKVRVVIDWGDAPLAWNQSLKPKAVVEVLPVGYVRDFPGYLDFVLQYEELVSIIRNPDANREWHRRLGAVSGVYLITDQASGKQYVGSASGAGGILKRWEGYAVTGHCGNVKLVELLGTDCDYARNFQFTILRTLPLTLTAQEVIAKEGLYKRKLGSRAFGLNSN